MEETLVMKVEVEDIRMTITIDSMERAILEIILKHNKDRYFEELNDASKAGVSIIHPDLIKRVYSELLGQIEL